MIFILSTNYEFEHFLNANKLYCYYFIFFKFSLLRISITSLFIIKMKDSFSKNIRITEIKNTKNWISWYDNIENILIFRNLWKYASDEKIEFVVFTESVFSIRFFFTEAETAVREKYDKNMMMYQTEIKKWSKSHAKIIIIIKFICEINIRVHLINIINAHKALVILKNLYEKTDSSIIDISYKEINRSNLKKIFKIETYAQHPKKHRKKIIQTNENIENWQMSSIFRINLSFRLNSYVFQLVHAAKNTKKVLIINEMITALIVEKKRTDYKKNNENTKTRSVKDEKEKKAFSNQSINEKKKKFESCSYCKDLFHNEKQYYYFYSELKKENWKSHKIKFQLIKSWNKEKNFVAFKSKKDDKNEKMKKIKSMISNSDESDSFFNSLRSVRIIKHCSIENSVKRLTHKFKNFNFWLNNAANRHLCYDKTLMHDIKSFTTFKLTEIANKRLIIVKNIEFITFSLNIRDKKMKNTLFNVEYVFDLNYHMISTSILNRKNCFVITKNDKLIIIDLKDDAIFMIEINQSEMKGNFYILNFWHFSIRKINAITFIWKDWHRRLKHFNM